MKGREKRSGVQAPSRRTICDELMKGRSIGVAFRMYHITENGMKLSNSHAGLGETINSAVA